VTHTYIFATVTFMSIFCIYILSLRLM